MLFSWLVIIMQLLKQAIDPTILHYLMETITVLLTKPKESYEEHLWAIELTKHLSSMCRLIRKLNLFQGPLSVRLRWSCKIYVLFHNSLGLRTLHIVLESSAHSYSPSSGRKYLRSRAAMLSSAQNSRHKSHTRPSVYTDNGRLFGQRWSLYGTPFEHWTSHTELYALLMLTLNLFAYNEIVQILYSTPKYSSSICLYIYRLISLSSSEWHIFARLQIRRTAEPTNLKRQTPTRRACVCG